MELAAHKKLGVSALNEDFKKYFPFDSDHKMVSYEARGTWGFNEVVFGSVKLVAELEKSWRYQ